MSSISFLNRTPPPLFFVHLTQWGALKTFLSYADCSPFSLSLTRTHTHTHTHTKCFLARASAPHWAKIWNPVTQKFHAGTQRLMWKRTHARTRTHTHTHTHKRFHFENNKAVWCYHTHKDDRTVYTGYAKKCFSHLLISAWKWTLLAKRVT
jgi:hypothetical protein